MQSGLQLNILRHTTTPDLLDPEELLLLLEQLLLHCLQLVLAVHLAVGEFHELLQEEDPFCLEVLPSVLAQLVEVSLASHELVVSQLAAHPVEGVLEVGGQHRLLLAIEFLEGGLRGVDHAVDGGIAVPDALGVLGVPQYLGYRQHATLLIFFHSAFSITLPLYGIWYMGDLC